MKILYLYNKKDWAIHNVGKLWFSKTPQDISVDMADYHELSVEDFDKYDYVWFSLYIYEKFNYDQNKSIITIHDPIELFPQQIDWKLHKIGPEKIEFIKQFRYLNVISLEIKSILTSYGISSFHISTSSLLPFREESEISVVDNDHCKLLSVANKYQRKNLPLLQSIKSDLVLKDIIMDIKLGDEVLLEDKYINLFDTHNTYICTSFQEGGPLPAMDAMARGLAVITTPVGQIQELVIDGYNGYICETKEEFLDKIFSLCSDKILLNKMRLNSLDSIKKLRDPMDITGAISKFLRQITK